MEHKKKKPLARAALSGVISDGTDETNIITKATAVELNKDQIQGLLKKLPTTAKQARRFVSHVAANPNAPTAQCNVAAAAVNLSDVALKYNPYISRAGYELKCRRPGKPIENRFGEKSGQVYWSLYQIGGVAA